MDHRTETERSGVSEKGLMSNTLLGGACNYYILAIFYNKMFQLQVTPRYVSLFLYDVDSVLGDSNSHNKL